jgi:hypothetical protein
MASTPIELFYCYSHRDEELRNELENHLAMLKREGVIGGWHDRRIGAGKEWEGEISTHLEGSRLILLLVSSDFLASDYCYDVEMKTAMEMHEAKIARVIPIILRPVDWSTAPFRKLQPLPTDGKPVTSWPNRDEAFLGIAKGIRAAAEELIGGSASGGSSGTTRLAEHLVAANEAAILRVLAEDYKSSPSSIGVHETELTTRTGLSLDDVILTVKGLEVKGYVETGNGTDDDRFGFAHLTAYGIKSTGPAVIHAEALSSEIQTDDEELGVLDLQVAAEEAIQGITSQLGRFSEFTGAATSKVTEHQRKLQMLKDSGGTASQMRSEVAALAVDLSEYAMHLESITPPMQDAWERMVQNTSGMIALAKLQSESDRETAKATAQVIAGYAAQQNDLIVTIQSSSEWLPALRGISQDLNRAVRRTERAVNGLANVLTSGKNYLETIVKQLRDKSAL